MTLYAFWLELCGLSLREAADFHGTRLDTVKSWSSGRNPAKPEIIAELRTLRARITRSADEGIAAWESFGRPASVELGVASDRHEAEALGWPCIGAQRMSIALVVAALPPEVKVRIVPRGSTPLTAAAADAHGR